MKERKRVILEPELEEIAMLWTASRCLRSGKKFIRWGHQLMMKGKIMLIDQREVPNRPVSLKRLPRRMARLN
jgi:hypothetical protein